MGREVIPEGVRYAPVPPELLQLDGVQLAHIRVWCHVWLQTLGRPHWDLSYGQLATGALLSRRSAIRAVAWLVERGWLTQERRQAPEGDDAPNLLRCSFPMGGGDTAVTTRSDTADTRGGDTGVTHQESHHQESHYQESASRGRDVDSDRQQLAERLDELGETADVERLWQLLREDRNWHWPGACLTKLDDVQAGGVLAAVGLPERARS